jgi:hypothetical protein
VTKKDFSAEDKLKGVKEIEESKEGSMAAGAEALGASLP